MAEGGGESPTIGPPPFTSVNVSKERDPNGLVLVFDMDQTLIDTSVARANNSNTCDVINKRLLEKILIPATILRSQGKVAAILLLSNNPSMSYVKAMERCLVSIIQKRVGIHGIDLGGKLFDTMMIASLPDYPGRKTIVSRGKIYVVKVLQDVQNMMLEIGFKPDTLRNLNERTFFFDDVISHEIRKEIPIEQYIHIVSRAGQGTGFTVAEGDGTNYSYIEHVLKELKGEEKNSPTVFGPIWGPIGAPPGGGGGGGGSGRDPELEGGRRSRRSRHLKRKSRKMKLKKRRTYRKRQRGGGQYCQKKEDGRVIDYVYCAAECDSEGVCGAYS